MTWRPFGSARLGSAGAGGGMRSPSWAAPVLQGTVSRADPGRTAHGGGDGGGGGGGIIAAEHGWRLRERWWGGGSDVPQQERGGGAARRRFTDQW